MKKNQENQFFELSGNNFIELYKTIMILTQKCGDLYHTYIVTELANLLPYYHQQSY